MKGSTGNNTSTIIDVRKQRSAYMKKGKAHCKKCMYLSFGSYCDKMKKTAEHVDKPKHCNFFIDRSSPKANSLKKEMDLTPSQRKARKQKAKKKAKKAMSNKAMK